jgi:hypothetical protein
VGYFDPDNQLERSGERKVPPVRPGQRMRLLDVSERAGVSGQRGVGFLQVADVVSVLGRQVPDDPIIGMQRISRSN